MADIVQEGDKVSWNWNGNQPGGTVGEVKAGEVSVTSHRGNEIKKTGDEENPAVHIERPGNDVVKKASELHIEKKSSGGDETEKEEGNKEVVEQNGAAKEKEDERKVGEKRKIDEKADAVDEDGQKNGDEGKEEGKEAKKPKIDDDSSKEAKRSSGRSKSDGEKKPAAKKEKKALVIGKTERKTRSQGAV